MISTALQEDAAAVEAFYGCLDALMTRTAGDLSTALASSGGLSPQGQAEREAHVARLNRRLAQLRTAERRLVFGRLDLDDGSRLYVGRHGLRLGDLVLLDWRAPAAAAFYQATPVSPGPVLRRRHLHLEGRKLVGVDEEIVTVSGESHVDDAGDWGSGTRDLLAQALTAPRTGRMRDIVSTLQAEQDRIIRSPGSGALVVTGAPGTGKTVVALHRAAYLLYTEPERRAGGVLVLGPNPRFLRYIDQVLPGLGETDVVLAQPMDLYPLAARTDGSPPPADAAPVARLKGELVMAEVLRRAVSNRQRTLSRPITITVDAIEMTLRPEVVHRARVAARRSGEPHNQARTIYAEVVLDDLAKQYAKVSSTTAGDEFPDGPGDPLDAGEAVAALHRSADVRREVNLQWMPLTPERVLRDLYADHERLTAATPGWPDAERSLLSRHRDAPWTREDLPLLDELTALLGPAPPSAAERAARAADAAARDEAVRFAGDTLRSYGVAEVLSADDLARRYGVEDHHTDPRPLAERAPCDASWAYGHVVVDEAQDLTSMEWRMVMRRCPSKSMTIVGDLNQRSRATSDPRPGPRPRQLGDTPWGQVLRPHLRHWRTETLTVNYRTPGEHLELAHRHLRVHGGCPPKVESARWNGMLVETTFTDDADLQRIIGRERATSAGMLAAVTATPFPGPAPRDVLIAAPGQVKGLEFDTVVVVNPDAIVTQNSIGDLYVSLTRATQRLVIARPLG